jgi:hypothetical protein
MKITLLVLFLSSGLAFAQANFVSNDLVVSNLERDTVYIKNDPTGKNIYRSWIYDPYYHGKKVTPILVDDLTVYHQRYEILAESTAIESKRKKKSRNKR